MKIALFTETYLPDINGVATHIKILKDGLEKHGHQVLVVKADADTNKYLTNDGVLHCPAVTSKKLYNYSLASPLSIRRLKLLKKYDPDIIHIHNEFGIGLSGALIARMLRKPLVYTLHTMYDEYLYYIAPRPFVPIVKKVSHTYARLLARNANALTGPSKKVEKFFRECGVRKKVNVIPNPVELDIFSPDRIDEDKKVQFRQKYGIPSDYTVACFCGRLGREKSVDILLEFWAESVDHSDKLRLLIIGNGPEKENLERMTKELGIDDMVVFTGEVPHDDLPPYYAGCDIYITASLSDTNSISMLEGMATGLPVLQLYDELNKDQVIDGITGYSFTDANDMYEKLKILMNQSEEEKERQRNVVRASVERANDEKFSSYLIDIYEEVIATSRSAKGVKS